MPKPDVHPVQHCPTGWTTTQRTGYLELAVGRLWDQVWWMNLPFWRRWYYWLQGYRAPIGSFYDIEL